MNTKEKLTWILDDKDNKYSDRKIKENIAFDRYLSKEKTESIQALGGFLPKIASVFHNLENIQFQDCYLKEDMPSGGIAYVFLS